MAVTRSTLDAAKNAFAASPQPSTCARYLSLLREAEEIGLADDDEFHDGLSAVEDYLWKGGSAIDWAGTVQ